MKLTSGYGETGCRIRQSKEGGLEVEFDRVCVRIPPGETLGILREGSRSAEAFEQAKGVLLDDIERTLAGFGRYSAAKAIDRGGIP